MIGGGHESNYLCYCQVLAATAVKHTSSNVYQMHCHASYPPLNTLAFILESESVSFFQCKACQFGKHHRASFPSHIQSRVSSPFELVHSDVRGPCCVLIFLVSDILLNSWMILSNELVILNRRDFSLLSPVLL